MLQSVSEYENRRQLKEKLRNNQRNEVQRRNFSAGSIAKFDDKESSKELATFAVPYTD